VSTELVIFNAFFLEPDNRGVSVLTAEVTGFVDLLDAFAPTLTFRFEPALQALLPASIVSTEMDHNGPAGLPKEVNRGFITPVMSAGTVPGGCGDGRQVVERVSQAP
jgi:hypothetical protein